MKGVANLIEYLGVGGGVVALDQRVHGSKDLESEQNPTFSDMKGNPIQLQEKLMFAFHKERSEYGREVSYRHEIREAERVENTDEPCVCMVALRPLVKACGGILQWLGLCIFVCSGCTTNASLETIGRQLISRYRQWLACRTWE